MGSIFVTDRDGVEHKIEANNGLTLMEIIRDAGLPIEASCGGSCACATCHVYVDNKWINTLPLIEDDEESMLDQAFEVADNSRLSCQIEYTEKYSGIRLKIAKE